jgi:excisionase family DNA binding protein
VNGTLAYRRKGKIKMPRRETSPEYLKRLNQNEYLRIAEAATLTSKGRSILYQAIYAGELKALKQDQRGYLIHRMDLDKWMQSFA